MGKYSRLGKNTALVFLGNAGSKMIALVMLPLYTRWLSADDYGLTDIISIYATLVMCIMSCSLSEALFIFPKGATDKNKKEYFSTGVLFLFYAMVITAILFTILSYINRFLAIENSFFDNIWLIYLMTISTLAQNVTQQFTRCLDKMSVYSVTGIIVTVSTVLFSFLLIPVYGFLGYILSLSLSNLTGTVYSVCFSGSFHYFRTNLFSRTKCVEMLRYSLPLIPNGVMWWLVGAFNRPIMEANIGLSDIGIFAVANKFPSILTLLFGIFAVSWQISVIEEYGKEGFSVFYNRIFRIVIIFVFVVFILISLFSQLLIKIFAAPDYFTAWQYVPVLTLGAVFSAVSSMCGVLFSAIKVSKYTFYSSVYGAVIAVVLNMILIPSYGLLGATASVLFSFVGMSISRIIFAWKYVKIENVGRIVLMALVAVLSLGIVFLFNGKYFYPFFSIMPIFIILLNYDMKKEMIEIVKMIMDKKRLLYFKK